MSQKNDNREDGCPSVSLIVVNHNGRRYLEPCLRSLRDLDYPKSRYEVILVDNASSDHSTEFVRQNFPQVKVIQLEDNYGFCLPNNIAAARAEGRYLALLNNDTEVDRCWLRELVNGLSRDPAIKAVASKILYSDDRKRINAAGGKLTVIGHGFYEGYGDKDGPRYDKPKYTGFGCGAAVLVERNFFLDIGGFDPNYFAGVEEHDLGWRIWTMGFKVYYMPTAKVYHWESGTYGRRAMTTPVKVFFGTRNRLLNMTKNVQSLSRGLLLLCLHDFGIFLYHLSKRRVQLAEAMIAAYVDYAKNFARVLRQRGLIQKRRRFDDSSLIRLEISAWLAKVVQ